MDKLDSLLARVKANAASRQVRTKARTERQCADDFIKRLAEKHIFRELLKDERLDGYRFRWFFERLQTTKSLDEIRLWIDTQIGEERERAKANLCVNSHLDKALVEAAIGTVAAAEA